MYLWPEDWVDIVVEPKIQSMNKLCIEKNDLTLQSSMEISLQWFLYPIWFYFGSDGSQLLICHREKTQGASLSKHSLARRILDAKILLSSTSFSWALFGGHFRKSWQIFLWALDKHQDSSSFRTNTHLLRTCWESSKNQMAIWQRHLLQMLRLTESDWKDSACLCTYLRLYPGDSYHSWQLSMVYGNTVM